MPRPHTMLLFLPGISKPLWEGAECVLLCLQVSAANTRLQSSAELQQMGITSQPLPCCRTCLTLAYPH